MSGNNNVIKAFTELAPNYEETVDRELRQFWGIGYREFIGKLLASIQIDPADFILDVATGTGIIPQSIVHLVGTSGRVVGLDITEAMLRHAHVNIESVKTPERVSMVCGSALEIPCRNDVFDAAICGLGMHHMNANQMLAEMARVLKPGGRLTMADVGASAFWRSFIGKVFLQILLIRYGLTNNGARAKAEMEALDNIYTPDEWRSLLSNYGFTHISITDFKARHPWHPSALIMQATMP